MQPWKCSILVATLAVAGLSPVPTARGDEPGRLGRLFRFGAATATREAATPDRPPTASDGLSGPTFSEPPPALIPVPSNGTADAQPRLLPQPRVSRPLTDADPIVTRVSIGRSDDGTRFGMFLMVYADGTVIDSEGVHQVGREAIKEVSAALARADFFRIRGHCGGPSTDFVEQVQVVVYERNLGRLRANSFSFSGNTQGCDHAVQHLQTALDGLQARLSRPSSGTVPPQAPGAESPASAPIRLNDGSPR